MNSIHQVSNHNLWEKKPHRFKSMKMQIENSNRRSKRAMSSWDMRFLEILSRSSLHTQTVISSVTSFDTCSKQGWHLKIVCVMNVRWYIHWGLNSFFIIKRKGLKPLTLIHSFQKRKEKENLISTHFSLIQSLTKTNQKWNRLSGIGNRFEYHWCRSALDWFEFFMVWCGVVWWELYIANHPKKKKHVLITSWDLHVYIMIYHIHPPDLSQHLQKPKILWNIFQLYDTQIHCTYKFSLGWFFCCCQNQVRWWRPLSDWLPPGSPVN